ncbi:cell growth-regulating nucleolar protein [Amblyomma americanum]
MVVFTCNACGDSLKKNQVEKHYYTKCRSCDMLTCIDCNKDFWGDAYKEHIKCVTEAERYGGKNFKPPVFKGEVKQQEWTELLSKIIATHDVAPRVRGVFERMQSFNNVPRKEKPFKIEIRPARFDPSTVASAANRAAMNYCSGWKQDSAV